MGVKQAKKNIDKEFQTTIFFLGEQFKVIIQLNRFYR
jgi:hypothetical protein